MKDKRDKIILYDFIKLEDYPKVFSCKDKKMYLIYWKLKILKNYS